MGLRKWFIVFASILFVALFSGCGTGKADETAGATVSNEPVTLQLYQYSSTLADEEFEQYFAQPVKKKLPNVTLELVRYGKDTSLDKLVAAGTTPDLFYISQAKFPEVFELNLQYDMSEIAKKNKFDLSRFIPETLDGIKVFSPSEGLYGLPFSYNSSALFYNKDLFDKFGQSYPKDKMAWDDVIELGKKLSRVDGGVQYKALVTVTFSRIGEQLSASYTDPKTDAPLFETEPWRNASALFKKIYDIPGNGIVSAGDFAEKKLAAMYPNTAVAMFGQLKDAQAKGVSINWDLVSYPSYPGAVGKALNSTVQILAMAGTSKNKDAAFQVLSVITGTENQLNSSRTGRISPLKDKKIKEQFGADSPLLAGKNLNALFLNPPNVPLPGKYDAQLSAIINKEAPKQLNGTKDINTFLREMNEAAKKAVDEEKVANGQK